MRVPLSSSISRSVKRTPAWRGRHRWTDHFLREQRGWRGYFPITSLVRRYRAMAFVFGSSAELRVILE
jgi:hypothetical protein